MMHPRTVALVLAVCSAASAATFTTARARVVVDEARAEQPMAAAGQPTAMRRYKFAIEMDALRALSDAHADAIDAIVGAFDRGELSVDGAASRIDTILSPSEAQAVLQLRAQYRSTMWQASLRGRVVAQRRALGSAQADAGRFLILMFASDRALRGSARP